MRFLKRNRLTNADASRALDVSGTAIFYWIRPNDPQVPTLENRVAIEVWTRGEVPANSWGASKTVVPFNAA